MMIGWPLLAAILLGMAVVMTAAWAAQRAAGNSGWIDVFWTYGTGIAGIAAALGPALGGPITARRWLVAALMAAWAMRLGTYILVRVAGSPHEDARYAKFRQDWGKAYQAKIYVLILPQALITAVMMVSVMLAAGRPQAGLDLRDGLACAVLAIAIGGESLADLQLARFKKTNKKKGAICDAGLWAWSRHPNYFFEWFGWLAYPVMALELAQPMSWLTLLAPIMMFVVLRFITGVPPLEQSMLASRGDAFRAYQAKTSAFIPLPPKGA